MYHADNAVIDLTCRSLFPVVLVIVLVASGCSSQEYEDDLSKYDLDLDRIYNLTYPNGTRTGKSKVEVLGEILKEQITRLRNAPGGKADLVFLIDSSTSVGEKHFWYELRFVEKLLVDFTVDTNSTRVALIRFSSESRVQRYIDHMTHPNAEFHKCSLMEEELPRIEYKYGGTYTLAAIREAQRVFKAKRADAKQAVFLVTDGYSNGGDPLPAAEELRRQNVEFFTFGIRGGNPPELWDMSSEPKEKHMYILDSFAEFEALARRALHEDLPIGRYIAQKDEKCHHLCPEGRNCCDKRAVCTCGTHTGKYECSCLPGYYGGGLEGGCLRCPAGTYKNQMEPGGVGTCLPCPDRNEISPQGSSSVDHCKCKLGFRNIGQHRCAEMTCPSLSPPLNGYFVQGKCNNVYNAACGMRCKPGYTLKGSSIRLCEKDGKWSGNDTKCLIKTCEVLRAPTNGKMECTKRDFSFETRCDFSCDSGYKLVGSKTRHCLGMGFWDGITATCREVECSTLPDLIDGFVQPSSCTTAPSRYGTVCRFMCRAGYKLDGAHSRQCTSSGKWNPKSDRDSICVDIAPPVLQGCPRDIVAETEPDDYIAKVSWVPPIAIDNSGFMPMVTSVPAVEPPVAIPIGTTRIKYIAEDGSKNKVYCTFSIYVKDTQPPRVDRCVSPPPFVLRNHDISVKWDEPEFSDNSRRPITVKQTHKPGKFPLGKTDVVYTAIDKAGNNNTCVITIIVKEHACANPVAPLNGFIDCEEQYDDVVCKLRCKHGYEFAIEPAAVYHCDYALGRWTPQDKYPFPDCSTSKLANHVVQGARLVVKTESSCDDKLKLNKIENNYWTKLRYKVKEYCPPNDICQLEPHQLVCLDDEVDNEISVLDNSIGLSPFRLHSRRRRSVIDNTIGAPPSRVGSSSKSKEARLLTVDFELSGRIANKGALITMEEQKQLKNDIIMVMNKIHLDAEYGELDEDQEYEVKVVEIRLKETEPRIVCEDGFIRHGNHCVACAPGTFFNVVNQTCEVCPLGTYQPNEAANTCLVCPDFTSTTTDNSKSISQCKGQCLPGTFSGDGLEPCETCPVGSYQPQYASKACLPCPNGTTTWGRGARQVTKCGEMCPAGYVSRDGLAPCFPCPRGHFQSEPGKSSCFRCPGAVNTKREAATDITECEGITHYQIRDYDSIPTSELTVNECFKSPCENNATCESMDVGFLCHCLPGWTGTHCESEIDECSSNPCFNNATCLDLMDSFKCLCMAGYEGTLCEVNIDECLSNPCLNNATCTDEVNQYRCECIEGYEGVNCEMNEDDCRGAPCQHGGTCIDHVAAYTCNCVAGFEGEHCEINVDECSSSPCQNNATCVDMISAYECSCLPGYTGKQCELEINECASDPCYGGATCLDLIAKYACVCPPAYSGVHCERKLNSTFDLFFAHNSGLTDYVALDGHLPDLQEVTVAFWMRANYTGNFGTPLSYATENEANALMITDYDGIVINIDGQKKISDIKVSDGLWHHMVVMWSSRDGAWAIYLDGILEEQGYNFARGKTIEGGGVLVLGQEQDARGGQFNSKESFVGHLSRLNVWKERLTREEIINIRDSCDEYTGSVLAWPDFLAGLNGRVQVQDSHLCRGCEPPANISSGFVKWNGTDTGDVAEYSCDIGFHILGSRYRTCRVNSTWDKVEPSCQRVRCVSRPYIANGRIISFANSYGSRMQFMCDKGYKMAGNDTLFCNELGTWEGEMPRCEEIVCPDVELDANVMTIPRRRLRKAKPGDTTRFYCKTGYTLIGEKTVRCLHTGAWSAPFPICNITVCRSPPSIPHGRPKEPDRLYKYGESAEYQCESGYMLGTSNSVNCISTGRWSIYRPSCKKIQCKPLTPTRNGQMHGSDFSYGSVVTYTCIDGYAMNGSAILRCMESGEWNGTKPLCMIRECPDPEPIQHGSVVTTNDGVNTTAQYSCDVGYVLRGSFLRRCLPNATWDGRTPTCELIRCKPPEPVKYGTIKGDEFYFGMYANFSCDPGYVLIGKPDMRCGDNGSWVNPAPICAPVACPDPPVLKHGIVIGKSFLKSDTIEFVCDAGYRLNGPAKRLCQDNGTWSGRAPSCEPINCTQPVPVQNGEYEVNSLQPGSVVTYTCDTGYEIEGKATRTCKSDGTWTGPTPKCTWMRCHYPEQIRHGLFIAHDNRYGSNIKYICDDGYELVGPENRTCTADKQWSGTAPECLQIKCDPPLAIANGKHIGVNYTVGAVIRYKCEPGYALDQETERKCSENRTWTGSEPKCLPIECEESPAVIPNGKLVNSTFTFNSTILYVCDEGYFTEDTPTRTCQADGTWLNPVPVCEPIQCPSPDRIPNGIVNGTQRIYNATIVYRCDEGYQVQGRATRRCLANGTWQGETPKCVPVKCQQLFSPINGKVAVTGLNYKDVAAYMCNSMYELVGMATRSCGSDGQWTGEQPVCKPVICGPPPTLANGEVLFKNVRAGDVVQYLCNPGFVLMQPKELLCTEHGNYSGDLPQCIRVQCKPPLKIRHGTVKTNGTRFGDYAHYTCPPGYNMIGDSKLLCNEKGRWVGTVPRCVPVQCPILPPIKYGWYTKHMTYEYGTNITFHCDIGYQVIGDKYVLCQADGTWTSKGPVCQLKECPPPNIPFAIIKVKSSLYRRPQGKSGYFYGMTIQVDCEPGYELSGVSELRCLSSARWTYEMPQCVPINCEKPEIPNAIIHAKDGFSFNKTITVSCLEGFVLSGEAELTCQADTSWAPELPRCATGTCPPPHLENGEFIVHQSPNTGFGYPFGIVLLFSCHEGYFLEGSETLTCESDDQWSDEYPICKSVDCERPSVDPDAVLTMSPVRDRFKYGETITFRCGKGYHLVGDETLYCSDKGVWNGTLPTCNINECPPINVSHAHLHITTNTSTMVPKSTTRFIHGIVVQLTCDIGYTLDGRSEVKCTENGTWDGPVPTCRPVRCPVPNVNHGRVVPPRGDIPNFAVGASVEIQCDRGYELAPNFRITCLPNGTWSDENAACSAITCEAPEVDAATVVSKRRNGVTQFTVDDEIRIICLTGYLLVGDDDRFRCTEQGTWNKKIPRCEKLRCKTPIVQNASILLNGETASEDSVYEFGDVIVITCNEGYQADGPTELKCTSSAKWSDPLPTCRPVRCPAVYVEHGLVIADDNKYGSVVRIECELGYELFGDSELTCKGRGEWSGIIPICAMIECPKPVIKHGKVLGSANVTYSFGSIISYQCDEGYVLLGERESLCLPDSTWSEGPPVCQRVICKKPPLEIEFGSVEVTRPSGEDDYTYGSVLNYKCDLGYRVDGLAELMCESNGQWTSDFSTCVQNVCPYPLIDNGYADGRARGRNGEYIFGDTVRFKCRPGFERVGTPEMFCDPEGNWTDAFPTCVRVECPEPVTIKNGTVQGESHRFGDVVVYSCDEGFELHGPKEVKCLADKTWSTLPTCSIILCQLPPEIKYGMYLATGLRYGDKIRYACETGYELFGEDEHHCQANRSWSGSIPECRPVKCLDPIPPLLDGRPLLQQHTLNEVVFVYKDKVHYECLDGHNLEGAGFVECSASGKWTALDTKCVLVSCEKPRSIRNGRLIESTHVYGSSVEYRCDEGYSLEGDEKLWCTAMGKWNGTVPDCLPVTCVYPDIPKYGVLRRDSTTFRTSEELEKAVPSGFHFGDVVEFVCDVGFLINGQNKIECVANGTWSTESPDCTRSKCVEVPKIPNGVLNGTHGSYGDKLSVNCDKGFDLMGKGYIECGEKQNWILHETRCSIITCPDPPSTNNGYVVGSLYTYNSTIQYRCQSGYQLLGQGQRSCLASGKWSGTTPSCTPIMCSDPDPILNGYYMIDAGLTLHFGVTITFGCDEGYELHGEETASCLASGNWSQSFAECTPIQCPDPDPIQHGTILGGVEHQYKDMIQYTCDIGYRIVGQSEFRTCSANGTWSGKEPTCQLVQCPVPLGVAHATISGTQHTYSSIVRYSCGEFYVLEGPELRTCLSNGTWSGKEPRCLLKTCPKPPLFKHGHIVGSNYSAGQSIQFVCDPGYKISGAAELSCLGDGWSNDFPFCRRVSCGQPPTLEHAVVKGDQYHYEDEVTYRCLKGYEAFGKPTLKCQQNGTWSELQMNCTPISCGPPPRVEHGFSEPDGIIYGDLAIYSCKEGYELSGNNLLECLADGTWGGARPVCKEIDCGAVPVIPHASFIVTKTTYKSVAKYVCNKGYTIRGADQVQCAANGSWVYASTPACIPLDCGPPPDINNGSFKAPSTLFGSVATYFCLEGYELLGSSTVYCGYDGSWNGTLAECRPVQCPAPSAPQNGAVHGEVFVFGSEIRYSCDFGFQLVGDEVRTCMASGKWGGQEPRCDLIYCGPLPAPQHGNVTFSDRRHYGSLAVFTCEPGYDLVGNNTLVCTAEGQWNDTEPLCVAKISTCPTPSLPPNVIEIRGQFVVGDTIVLQCKEGYQQTAEMTITCQDDLWWTEPEGKCQRVSCGPPPSQPWVLILGSSFNFGDKVVYMCRRGLTPATEPVLTCGKDGLWDKVPKCLATCTFPCENGGTCVGRNICKCVSGFAGRFCEEAVCVLPCLHGGRCTGPYKCTCAYGFSGARCEKPVCSRPCKNGGVCVAPNRCYCPHGFRPPFCDR